MKLRLAVITALLALGYSPLYAAPVVAEVTALEARLFLSHSGQFSEPINESSELWNTIIGEGDATRPSSSTIVKVVVSGPPRGYAKKALVALTVSKPGSKDRPVTLKKSLGVFNAEGQQYVAFWLPFTGCEELQLTARTNASAKAVGQRIPFRCGE